MALHFVGVIHPKIAHDPEYDKMVMYFGLPDFVHRRWDVRAKQEVVRGDVCVFRKGTHADEPATQAYDDSAQQ